MSSTLPTPTTELDAVNQMLRAIGETPVSSLNNSEGLDVPTAMGTLNEVSLAVLIEGWDFNTEYNYPLMRDTSGAITLPSHTLNADFDSRSLFEIDPVARGVRVYDRKNHTYKFTQNLKATLIVSLAFDELPQAARYYIAYRAARKFQDTEVGSTDLHRFNEADEYRARATFIERHSDDQDLNMLRDTPQFAHLR